MIETVSPESVEMSSDRLKAIDIAMQGLVDEGRLAGISTLIARRGKVVHFGCYGKLDMAADKPIHSDSLFRIYSLTKPITSVAALILYEAGHFDLNDPVSKWIHEFKDFQVLQESAHLGLELNVPAREMTIWHLLTHTSGLGYGFDPQPIEPIEALYRDAKIFNIASLSFAMSLPEIIQTIATLPLAARPGEIWHYGLSHDVLGYLIELISGVPFDEFLHERIFEPLHMSDTSFYVPQEKLERFGPLYSAPGENGISIFDEVNTSAYIRPDVVPGGGGGLVSSMTDYLSFMLMLANRGELNGVRLLKQSTVKTMTTNQLSGSAFPVRFGNEPWQGMGFGLGIGVQVIDPIQFGWIGLSGTSAWIFPREDMIVIAMPQALGYGEAGDMLLKMAREAIMI